MIISENDFQPCNYFQTSVRNLENSQNIFVMSEKIDTLNDQEPVMRIFKTFRNKFIDKTCLTKEKLVINF